MWFQHTAARRRLALGIQLPLISLVCFNTQPPEGGWGSNTDTTGAGKVSTHSRPKAAGFTSSIRTPVVLVSTHSRPKAAGRVRVMGIVWQRVSTHSRPKAAGCRLGLFEVLPSCFNTQPPEGGWVNPLWNRKGINGFNTQPPEGGW